MSLLNSRCWIHYYNDVDTFDGERLNCLVNMMIFCAKVLCNVVQEPIACNKSAAVYLAVFVDEETTRVSYIFAVL